MSCNDESTKVMETYHLKTEATEPKCSANTNELYDSVLEQNVMVFSSYKR